MGRNLWFLFSSLFQGAKAGKTGIHTHTPLGNSDKITKKALLVLCFCSSGLDLWWLCSRFESADASWMVEKRSEESMRRVEDLGLCTYSIIHHRVVGGVLRNFVAASGLSRQLRKACRSISSITLAYSMYYSANDATILYFSSSFFPIIKYFLAYCIIFSIVETLKDEWEHEFIHCDGKEF